VRSAARRGAAWPAGDPARPAWEWSTRVRRATRRWCLAAVRWPANRGGDHGAVRRAGKGSRHRRRVRSSATWAAGPAGRRRGGRPCEAAIVDPHDRFLAANPSHHDHRRLATQGRQGVGSACSSTAVHVRVAEAEGAAADATCCAISRARPARRRVGDRSHVLAQDVEPQEHHGHPESLPTKQRAVCVQVRRNACMSGPRCSSSSGTYTGARQRPRRLPICHADMPRLVGDDQGRVQHEQPDRQVIADRAGPGRGDQLPCGPGAQPGGQDHGLDRRGPPGPLPPLSGQRRGGDQQQRRLRRQHPMRPGRGRAGQPVPAEQHHRRPHRGKGEAVWQPPPPASPPAAAVQHPRVLARPPVAEPPARSSPPHRRQLRSDRAAPGRRSHLRLLLTAGSLPLPYRRAGASFGPLELQPCKQYPVCLGARQPAS
jgi:hypothetical protein